MSIKNKYVCDLCNAVRETNDTTTTFFAYTLTGGNLSAVSHLDLGVKHLYFSCTCTIRNNVDDNT